MADCVNKGQVLAKLHDTVQETAEFPTPVRARDIEVLKKYLTDEEVREYAMCDRIVDRSIPLSDLFAEVYKAFEGDEAAQKDIQRVWFSLL